MSNQHLLEYTTNIGLFWIEADGIKVPFEVSYQPSKGFYRDYAVDERIWFKPIFPENQTIVKLELKSDIDWSNWCYTDIISDDWVIGYDMFDEARTITFGTGARINADADLPDAIPGDVTSKTLPTYYDVTSESGCLFSYASKTFTSIDDLAINFACSF